MLAQTLNGMERVIYFAGRTMAAAERNSSTTERECLAFLCAIHEFRPNVKGYHFKVVTAHSILKNDMHNPVRGLARWSLAIQAYEFEVEHHKGSLNFALHA